MSWHRLATSQRLHPWPSMCATSREHIIDRGNAAGRYLNGRSLHWDDLSRRSDEGDRRRAKGNADGLRRVAAAITSTAETMRVLPDHMRLGRATSAADKHHNRLCLYGEEQAWWKDKKQSSSRQDCWSPDTSDGSSLRFLPTYRDRKFDRHAVRVQDEPTSFGELAGH